MSTVARIPRDRPRRIGERIERAAAPTRSAQILQWYTSLPEQELVSLMHDVDACVRDIAPAFVEQTTRIPHGETVTSIVEKAFAAFVGSLDDPARATEEIGPVFTRVGKQMALDGVEIETMQRTLGEASALIVQRLEHLLDRHPLSASLAVHLVSIVTVYLAQLREHVERGQRVGAPVDLGGRRERAEVFRLLCAGATPETIAAFVDRTGIPVPARVAAVCLGGAREALHRLPPLDVVAILPASGPLSDLLVAEPDLAVLTEAAEALPTAARLVVGPTVPACRARESLSVARAARGHLDAGSLPRSTLFRCDDHLIELALLSDHVSPSALVERRLAPLAQLPEKDREQYAAVLYAVLATGKSVRQLARDLHYHQQTLQSRVNRLRAAYGDDLDDPDVRVEIMLALRVVGRTGS